MEASHSYLMDGLYLALTLFLIILNGFFVAAEFALVKLTKSKIKNMINSGRPFAKVAEWLFERQNMVLSACQLGITMASLALGAIGEPTIESLVSPLIHASGIAALLAPVLESIGLETAHLTHFIAVVIAFSLMTFLHIIVGEQVPKIYAIRKPSATFGWTALPLKFFYKILWLPMAGLNAVTNYLLKIIGIEGGDSHDTPLSEEEIRSSLGLAHAHGELSQNEHQLLNAVFRFDDQVTHEIMVPRREIAFLNIEHGLEAMLEYAKKAHYTRLPLCKGSMDELLGVVHIKDLLAVEKDKGTDLKSIARKPQYVPENIPISHLLNHFKQSKQHLAFVMNEHGTVTGIVTLENVLEQLVGNVQDEFDMEIPDIVQESEGVYVVDGGASLYHINDSLDINLNAENADTLSGLLVERLGPELNTGQSYLFKGQAILEVMKIEGIRATQVRLSLERKNDTADKNTGHH